MCIIESTRVECYVTRRAAKTTSYKVVRFPSRSKAVGSASKVGGRGWDVDIGCMLKERTGTMSISSLVCECGGMGAQGKGATSGWGKMSDYGSEAGEVEKCGKI